MKIDIYFLDKMLGTVEDREDRVIVDGGSQVQVIVDHYERQGYRGKALIHHLLERLTGHTWAKPSGGAALAIEEKEEEVILPDPGPSEDRLY